MQVGVNQSFLDLYSAGIVPKSNLQVFQLLSSTGLDRSRDEERFKPKTRFSVEITKTYKRRAALTDIGANRIAEQGQGLSVLNDMIKSVLERAYTKAIEKTQAYITNKSPEVFGLMKNSFLQEIGRSSLVQNLYRVNFHFGNKQDYTLWVDKMTNARQNVQHSDSPIRVRRNYQRGAPVVTVIRNDPDAASNIYRRALGLLIYTFTSEFRKEITWWSLRNRLRSQAVLKAVIPRSTFKINLN